MASYIPVKGTCNHCKFEQLEIPRGGQWFNDKWLCSDCIELPSKDTGIYLICRYCGNPNDECATRICDTCDVKSNLTTMKMNGIKSGSLLIENQDKIIKAQEKLIEDLENRLKLSETKASVISFELKMQKLRHDETINTMALFIHIHTSEPIYLLIFYLYA